MRLGGEGERDRPWPVDLLTPLRGETHIPDWKTGINMTTVNEYWYGRGRMKQLNIKNSDYSVSSVQLQCTVWRKMMYLKRNIARHSSILFLYLNRSYQNPRVSCTVPLFQSNFFDPLCRNISENFKPYFNIWFDLFIRGPDGNLLAAKKYDHT